MRNAKYLNAREYAQMLWKSNNADVADFGEDFLEALEIADDLGEIQTAIDRAVDNQEAGKTYVENVEWLEKGSDTLIAVEELISNACPEYAEMDTEEIIADMIKRLRPKQEYDL